jgi:hypothetical protein
MAMAMALATVGSRMVSRESNGTANAQLNHTESHTPSSPNGTIALILSLDFEESKSIRTSTIILAVFNSLAALGTAFSITYDCYRASKRHNPKFKEKYVNKLW